MELGDPQRQVFSIVLSPDAVPPKFKRQDWETNSHAPAAEPAACNRLSPGLSLLVPTAAGAQELLPAAGEPLDALRAIEPMAIGLHVKSDRMEIAALRWFTSRGRSWNGSMQTSLMAVARPNADRRGRLR